MKKIQIIFFCALIMCMTQLDAMKRDQSQMTTTPEDNLIDNLAPELIIKIATPCDDKTRTSLSLINKYFNLWASIKNNAAILYDDNFNFETNPLYYLSYGCNHNIEPLVRNVLRSYEPLTAARRLWIEFLKKNCEENKTSVAIITHLNHALEKKD